MYLNFYGLHKKPFSLAPDPDFLYLSPQHKDALGAIIYGIKEREGFVAVVGEVGTGKTTIIRSYLQKYDRNKILPIFVFNSRISFSELLETFLQEIGIAPDLLRSSRQLNDMVRLAYRAMLDKMRKGINLVLIIDEAQNMPLETLSSLSILSNFETAKAKLIQIVLVGQPELQRKLDRYELRQIRQRIAYKALITPLSLRESFNYFHHRLSLSSKGQRTVFSSGAVKRIIRHAKGVPRVINVLSENSLVAGYGLQKRTVSAELVKQVIAEYEGGRPAARLQAKALTVGLLLFLFGVLLIASYLNSFPLALKESIAESEPAAPFPRTDKPAAGSHVGRDSSTMESQGAADRIALSRTPSADLKPGAEGSTSVEAAVEPTRLQPRDPLAAVGVSVPLRAQAAASAKADRSSGLPVEAAPMIKIVKKGDTVSKLCLETYGFYNTRILFWLKSHNPHISNMDQIQIGGIIFFPEMESRIRLQLHQRVDIRSGTINEEVV